MLNYTKGPRFSTSCEADEPIKTQCMFVTSQVGVSTQMYHGQFRTAVVSEAGMYQLAVVLLAFMWHNCIV